MKLKNVFRTRFMVLLIAIAAIAGSCKKDDGGANDNVGTIAGVVTDKDTGTPLAGVTVTVSGTTETVTTGADGKYTISVSKESHSVTFSKTSYLTTSSTITLKDFGTTNTATVDVAMQYAAAKIVGTITDAKNNNAPFAGVTVTIANIDTVVSGSDGKYILENLVADNYTVTFSKAGYPTVTMQVTKDNFVNDQITLNVVMSDELLRGLTTAALANADKWYYNEYRGGGNADSYPHWDWACDYMCSNSFVGDWQEQWEGTTLRIRNDADNQKNPANPDVFDTYTYGSKKITADNKILSLRVRTHDLVNPTVFGVQVVDLSDANPHAVKIGDTKSYASDQYADYSFDLSAYVGKEVIIAVGTYRMETGDYWRQLAIRAIRFANAPVTGIQGWWPGTEVKQGWALTQEMVRSTMPQTKKSFTGISTGSAGRDVDMTNGYPSVYTKWHSINHVAAEWSFVPLKKDPEVTPSEGYLIKTRNTAEVSTTVPEAYLYAKFSIASGRNKLTFKTRNFSADQFTYFKLTAIKEDGTMTDIAPSSNTAQSASAAENGCWKFKHNAGGASAPDEYASFVYDLSQFNGSNVVLVLGVYNGVANSGENKLVFYSIDLN